VIARVGLRAAVQLAGALVCAVALTGQGPTPEIVILSPASDAVLSGRVTLEAELRPPGTAVREVIFYVDGARACAFTAPPFRCEWDTGSKDTPRDVRVVADLSADLRVARTIRTQQPTRVFRASADSVAVSVHVRDRSGRPVRGLDQKSFRVFEDGMQQDLLSFSAETAATDVVVALDGSGSMETSLPELKIAAADFLRALRPSDAVTVAVFNTALSILSRRGAPLADRLAALDDLRAAGSTALYDTMIQAVEILRGPVVRRALVILTDGDDRSSRASSQGARVALQSSDVILYVIAQGKGASDRALRDQLTALAAETGGSAFFAERMSSLKEHFTEIVDELASHYVLGYVPRRPYGEGGWRRITVEMTDADRRYRVRARSGYLAVRRAGTRP
jgi:Ca-activated chloride channel family protein